MVKYKVQWGVEKNTDNGVYDIAGVLKQLQACAFNNCIDWEEAMWESVHVGDFIIELLEGKTVMVPYQGEGFIPTALIITPIKED